jgi:AcrR family transcriptional regulator
MGMHVDRPLASTTMGGPRTVQALHWVREPVQARSQATLARILDATELLLNDHPFDALSVQQICKAARSSVGAFYTRFPDKLAVLHLLQERFVREGKATVQEALAVELWRELPLATVVQAVVGFAVAAYHERVGLRREIARRVGIDATFARRAQDISSFTVQHMAAILADHRAETTLRDPVRAADFCHRVLFAVLDQHALSGDVPPTGVRLGADDLNAELCRCLLAYLGVAPMPPSPANT